MKIQETWNVRYGNIEIKDKELLNKIAELVKNDIAHRVNEIYEKIQNLTKEFIEQHYSEEELEANVKYEVILYSNGYDVLVNVYVYPTFNPDVAKYGRVIAIGYTYYTSSSYVKERNMLGELIKGKVSIYEQYNKLLEEKIELEKKLKEAENRIKELEERLGEQEEEDP